MNKADIFDWYTDYLVTSFSNTTVTALSTILDNAVSYEQVTRFPSQQDLTSKELWKLIKKSLMLWEVDDLRYKKHLTKVILLHKFIVKEPPWTYHHSLLYPP